jgi:hypothetical protein
MKWLAFAIPVVLLCSCQTTPSESPPVRDYDAMAAAALPKFTISDNNVYGFTPEGRLDPGLPVLATRKDGAWTVLTVAAKKGDFDSVDVTVDSAGTIVRLQFHKVTHTAFGRQDEFNTIYQSLKSKYKAVQTLGDADTAELTINVAADASEWKQHYVQYLQMLDEPSNLGLQSCWILQPHLSLIQATFRREGEGSRLMLDFQTKIYAAALKAQAAAAAAAAAKQPAPMYSP